MVKLTITREGDWKKANRMLRGLTRTVPEASAIMLHQAHLSRARLVKNIENQVYTDWPPASPNYVQKDPRLLIETGQYIGAIRVLPMGPLMWGIGIPRTATNDKGKSLAAIGFAHEYGLGNLPVRSHWRRESATFKGQLSKALSVHLHSKVSLAAR